MVSYRFSLEPGNYIFREIIAPEGYELSTDIQFTLTEDGEIINVIAIGYNRVIGSYIIMIDEYKEIPPTPEEPPIPDEPYIPEEPTTPFEPTPELPEYPVAPEVPLTPSTPEVPEAPPETPVLPPYDSPKTGDEFNLGFYISMISLSIGVLTYLGLKEKKNSK